MTLTVTTSTGWGPWPYVAIDVASSPAVTDEITVTRVHSDGSRHEVLTGRPAVLAETWAGYDYHAPFNVTVQYEAVSSTETGLSAATALWNSRVLWLIDPSTPARSIMVTKWAIEPFELSYPTRAKSFQVLNRKLPVYRSDFPLGGEEGSVWIKCETPAARAAVLALMADDGPILMNSPYAEGGGWKWIQPSDLKIKNPSNHHLFSFRYASFNYTECSAPDVNVVARTYDSAEADFPGDTYDDIAGVYDTYRDSTLDVRS